MKSFNSRWINSEVPGTIYYVKKDDFSGPVVEMVRTDGYTYEPLFNRFYGKW